MTMLAFPLDETEVAVHVPVLLEELIAALEPRDGELYLDLTVGWGGHAARVLERAPKSRVIAFDRDPVAVQAARERLADFGDRARVVQGRFAAIEGWLRAEGIDAVDGIITDLGVSSPQFDDPERGMSFRQEGPIDMRMDQSEGETGLELIARLDTDDLADLIYTLGEERRSRRVARCIKQAEAAGRLRTTLDLRRAVVRAVGPRRVGGVDPATRTFQALRIGVNRELDELADLLEAAPRLVRAGGRMVAISFHSLEDRLVKQAFADRSLWTRLNKKPLVAGPGERERNPRSRSAKLRAARRNAEGETSEDSDPEAWRYQNGGLE